MEYNGFDYMVRQAFHMDYGGEVLIGSKSLEDAIMNKDGDYVDEEARCIDEQIYAYADDEIVQNLSDEDFEDYVNEYFD